MKRKVSPPSRLSAKHDEDVLHNQVGLMGGPISPKEFYLSRNGNTPTTTELHGFLMQPSARTSAIAWQWGYAPTTVEQGSLRGPIWLPSGDDLPIIRFWTNGRGVRPINGSLSPYENLLLISQDTFAHILRETSTILDDPFPDHTTAEMSIILAMYDTMADGSFHVQHIRAFVIPNIFAHALADLPN